MTDLEFRRQFLEKVPIFSEIQSDRILAELATNLQEEAFPANQTIFTKGDRGNLLYLLVSGKVRVHLEDYTLAHLESGAYFGEMALFESRPRAASVTTLQESICLILTQQQVYQAIKESPSIAFYIINVLADRVRKLNRLFGASEALFYSTIEQQSQKSL